MAFFRRKERASVVNLLEIRPIRNLQYEIDEEGKVVLFVPKFQNAFAVKWILPRIRKKRFRVRLDPYGSFVWNHCDGATTVADISQKLSVQFGEQVDPTYGRIQRFVQMFLKDKFLILPDEANPGP